MDGPIAAIANCASIIALQPADVIKTNYVVGSKSAKQIIVDIWNRGRLRAFYAGLAPNLISYPIFWATYFAALQKMDENWPAKHFVASVIGSTVANPFFVIKTRMQSSGEGIAKVCAAANKSGAKTYFKGLAGTYFGNIQFAAQFMIYDRLRARNYGDFAASFVAKFASAAVFYPFDIARTLQRNSDAGMTLRQTFAELWRGGNFYRGFWLYGMMSFARFYFTISLMNLMRREL